MERVVNVDNLRIALRILGAGGKPIQVSQLYDPLGLKEPDERRDVRGVLKDMVRRGEARRVSDGEYTYNEDYRPRERTGLVRVWRFVRKEKPGWKTRDAVLKTGVCIDLVQEYCKWLEEEGYIEIVGIYSKARMYRATVKADRTPDTPHPPAKLPQPFEREKIAAMKIVGLMLRKDVRRADVARDISAAARVLLARFDKTITENENEEKEHAE